jgi:hypothetical protein
VEPRPQLQAESGDRVADGTGTPNGPSRCVEGGEHAVTRGLDLPTSVPLKVCSHDRVVGVQEGAPRSIADRAGALGRPDDVGEQNRGQHSLGWGRGSHPGQELLDLVYEGVCVAGAERVVVAR